MGNVLTLHSALSDNNINGYKPSVQSAYGGTIWADSSGNKNHGYMSGGSYGTSNLNWQGGYNFSNYFNLTMTAGAITINNLWNTAFPQTAGTIHIVFNPVNFTNNNNSFIFGGWGNSGFFARLDNNGAGGYGVQFGFINGSGSFLAVIPASASSLNLNMVNKLTLEYSLGSGGYIKLFVNGVLIQTASTNDTTTRPTGQYPIIHNNGGDTHNYYYVSIDNYTYSDSQILAWHNSEWKIPNYTLPVLNKTYMALGDSITWTAAADLNYPVLVYNYVKANYGKVQELNKGIGGATSNDLVTNFYWSRIPANIITIGIGMNDCASQAVSVSTYTSNLNTLISKFLALNPKMKIILCAPNGTADTNRTPYIQSYRNAMQSVASSNNVLYCDFSQALSDSAVQADYNGGSGAKLLTGDGVHPTIYGHTLLMAQLQPIIASIINLI